MTKFVIKGTDDKARALLDSNLEAQKKAFEAGLDNLFKSPAHVTVTAVPVRKAAAQPAAKPTQAATPSRSGRGTLLGTNRERRFV